MFRVSGFGFDALVYRILHDLYHPKALERIRELIEDPTSSRGSRTPWFDLAFGPHYEFLYARRDAESAGREARFAVERLSLSSGDRVLDLACGPGHHVAILRELGIDAFGLDRSPALARSCHSAGPVVRGDMRRLPVRGPLDGVLTFFTTLGYFEPEHENRSAFEEIARVLGPGGGFLFDHLNPEAVRRSLVAESEREAGGRRVRERRWIEEEPSPRVCKRVEAEGIEPYTECVRLYRSDELAAELSDVGLSVDAILGDFDGSRYGPDSPRMILTGRRKP